MSHVLEHIPKENIILTLIDIKQNLLKEDGAFFIAVPNAQSNTNCYWAYEDFTHSTLFTAGSLLYVLKAAGFKSITFVDPYGYEHSSYWKKIMRRLLLKIYDTNNRFWNSVTGSTYHLPSPKIYTWELRALIK